ncbi:MAG: MBL fold metallo-hydrolase, partial [Actinomycetes bacterium]
THGHLDHTFAVTPVCASYAAPCWIHPEDRALLADPLRAMGPETAALLARVTGGTAQFVEPDEVRELTDRASVEVAGLSFTAVHAPGHTPGSVMFSSPYAGAEVEEVVFAGDVLFAGAIGRTDLPGGDDAAMRRTLRDVVLALPDTAAVLPGHGAATTIGRERAANPYLQPSYLQPSYLDTSGLGRGAA